MSSNIPTSTSVLESVVIKAPLSHVWHFIKLQDFSKFWSTLSKSEFVKGANEEADLIKWTFKDGSVYEVKQEEHSSINHSITYSIITSSPELTYSSVLSTIRLHAVTAGDHAGSTYVEWSAHFSSDATAEVISDAKYKRIEALRDLEQAAIKA
ncbi:polyketide cyclase dehydrase [Diaporthe amygdali]|nr:polyketide cyclase dehydrase [Diaporthe amygdali]KAJ0115008.1 polyketide cyclase dehydrase [Diaporthe amygdali]